PVLAPERPVCETDFASVWETSLVQRPPLQRTRVSNASARYAGHRAARFWEPASYRITNELPDKPPTVLIKFHVAGRNTGADVSLEKAIHGCGRHTADRAQHFARQVRSTIAITKLREIENNRIRRLRGNPGDQLWQ